MEIQQGTVRVLSRAKAQGQRFAQGILHSPANPIVACRTKIRAEEIDSLQRIWQSATSIFGKDSQVVKKIEDRLAQLLNEQLADGALEVIA